MTNREYVMSLPIEEADRHRERIMRRWSKLPNKERNARYRRWLREERWK